MTETPRLLDTLSAAQIVHIIDAHRDQVDITSEEQALVGQCIVRLLDAPANGSADALALLSAAQRVILHFASQGPEIAEAEPTLCSSLAWSAALLDRVSSMLPTSPPDLAN